MKNILYKSFLAVCACVLLASCEEDLIVYDTPNGFIQLNAESGQLTEAEPPIVTSVLLGTGSNENGVTVNFTVTSADPSRYTVSPASGTLTIPAGEFTADITITPLDNIIVDGDLEIEVTLEPSSDLPVGLGGEGINFVTRNITLVDDDCPIDINAMLGTYSVSEQFTGGVNAPFGLGDFFGESYQVELALAPDDPSGTKVIITNSTGFDTYFSNGIEMSFLTCANDITFNTTSGFPVVALFRRFIYDDSSYDVEAGTIRASGPLATFGPYEFILTRLD